MIQCPSNDVKIQRLATVLLQFFFSRCLMFWPFYCFGFCTFSNTQIFCVFLESNQKYVSKVSAIFVPQFHTKSRKSLSTGDRALFSITAASRTAYRESANCEICVAHPNYCFGIAAVHGNEKLRHILTGEDNGSVIFSHFLLLVWHKMVFKSRSSRFES